MERKYVQHTINGKIYRIMRLHYSGNARLMDIETKEIIDNADIHVFSVPSNQYGKFYKYIDYLENQEVSNYSIF